MMRKGVSPVVATVLLLVITVLLASLIMTFAVPFVQDQLGRSKECLAVIDAVTFADSRFNCYIDDMASTSATDKTGFSVSISKEGVSGVRVSLIDANENSNVVVIKQGATFPPTASVPLRNIGTGTGNLIGDPLTFPSGAGQRTYVAEVSGVYYKRAEIAPVVTSGRTCAVSDTVEFNACPTGTNGVSL
jgi:flagellin-like protein